MSDFSQEQLEPIIISILQESDAQYLLFSLIILISRSYTIRTIREKVASAIGVECDEMKKPEIKELLGRIVDKHLSSIVCEPDIAATGKADITVKPTKAGARKTKTKPKARNNAKTLVKLKAFVLQCGVRKIWKRELEGLDERESIKKVRSILQQLGVEGAPTAEKCEKIRDKRELAEDIQALDPNKTLLQRERRPRRHQMSLESSNEECCKPRLDLSALGDPESE
jgi:hypothetical protein